jgi:glycosyltransferase involved in cell wall biosynthesis
VSREDLVSVVIPAHNAVATLDETLHSVRAQTHRALDIVVVDDGSSDDTRALALGHGAADTRVRVLHQANAGVAAARNAGWRSARSELIAFVDADDLWAPTKIERQLAALQAAGPGCGLVYCWAARIDAAGAVLHRHRGPRHEGRVVDAILRANIVGNGSAALVRRQALLDVGGFDSRLRSGGGEGCEDWLLYARIALQYEYALVADCLVGYRDLPGSMSRHRLRMLRSNLLMCEQLLDEHPTHATAIRAGLRHYGLVLMRDAQVQGDWKAATELWWLLRSQPRVATALLARDLPLDWLRRLRARVRRLVRRRPTAPPQASPRPHFLPGTGDTVP